MSELQSIDLLQENEITPDVIDHIKLCTVNNDTITTCFITPTDMTLGDYIITVANILTACSSVNNCHIQIYIIGSMYDVILRSKSYITAVDLKRIADVVIDALAYGYKNPNIKKLTAGVYEDIDSGELTYITTEY